ncbi:MAG: glycine cleavage system protein GcvH [Thermoplasmata archaeon]|nr:MAG: glycine cleavage system protein GcvH [Thermoplasmata archaeon]
MEVDEINIPDDLKYTKTSEWLRVEEDNKGRIGITDYAQKELTDIVYVEPPAVDAEFERGSEFGVVESVKAVADFYAPVGCKVIEINEKLVDTPELMNQDPYGEGWMALVEITDQSELEELLDAAAYAEHIKSEKEKHG